MVLRLARIDNWGREGWVEPQPRARHTDPLSEKHGGQSQPLDACPYPLVVGERCIHRLLVTAVWVCSKLYDDCHCDWKYQENQHMKAWLADAGGITTQELSDLERQMVLMMPHALYDTKQYMLGRSSNVTPEDVCMEELDDDNNAKGDQEEEQKESSSTAVSVCDKEKEEREKAELLLLREAEAEAMRLDAEEASLPPPPFVYVPLAGKGKTAKDYRLYVKMQQPTTLTAPQLG